MFFSLTWDAYLHCFFLGHGSGVETSHQTLTADCCSSGAKLFPFMAVASHRAELSGSLPCFVSQRVEGCVSAGGALLSLCMISSFGAKNVVGGWPPWFWWLELHPAFLNLFGSLSCEMLDFSHWPDLSFGCGRGIIPASGTGWSWRGAKRLSPRPLDQLVASNYDLEGNSTSQKRILFLKGSTRTFI